MSYAKSLKRKMGNTKMTRMIRKRMILMTGVANISQEMIHKTFQCLNRNLTIEWIEADISKYNPVYCSNISSLK